MVSFSVTRVTLGLVFVFVTRVTLGLAPPTSLKGLHEIAGLRGGVRSAEWDCASRWGERRLRSPQAPQAVRTLRAEGARGASVSAAVEAERVDVEAECVERSRIAAAVRAESARP